MDTQLLKAFLAIVDQGSFSAAAERLHITQPAVSKRLATLETQLDQALIERGQRKLVVTEAGRILLPYARRILDESHNARMALAQSESHPGGSLSVITSHHIGLHHLPNWLKVYTQRFPAVQLNLQFMESEQAFDALEKREAELAFVTLNDRSVERFEIHHRWEDPMRFVCARDHPLAKLAQCGLKDLAIHQAILPAPSTATYQRVSQLFLQEGIPLTAQMPTNYLETVKMMTSVGLGWSIMPLNMVDEQLVVLPLAQTPTRYLGAVGLRNRQLGAAAQALIEVAQKEHESG
jgi:DNA-binding transcriptional LysR family regulator